MTAIQDKRAALVLDEPALRFGFGQCSTDPKEGLFLFGPADSQSKPSKLRVGVIGTKGGIKLYSEWVQKLQHPVYSPQTKSSVFFPGFGEIFSCDWSTRPDLAVVVDDAEISNSLRLSQRHHATFQTVSLFFDGIARASREEDIQIDVWFVIVPEEVHKLSRPKSVVPQQIRIDADVQMNASLARRLQNEPSLFEDDMVAAQPFFFDLDFRNQLKARLVTIGAVTQILRESTLYSYTSGTSRRLQDPATVAWNVCTSTYYKCGGKPWLLADTREDVCYVGLVFKKDVTGPTASNACCGAQMFLADGDGMVFKGRLGPWYSQDLKEFHLSEEVAQDISKGVAESFREKTGRYPKEIFIHGKTRFRDEEWKGFVSGVPAETAVVGVRITRSDEFKLYRQGQMPVIRGTSVCISERLGYLWTSGYVPALGTYPGWETPNPLRIEISRGSAEITAVFKDVLNLTKLNFNSCLFGDGLPVTLRFADGVGEILTAAPNISSVPLPFKHYI